MTRLTDEEKAARKADREAKYQAAIERRAAELAAKAPPLTAEQIVRLRDIFAGRDVVIPKKRVVDTAQAAQMLKCGVRQVTRMRKQGRLRGRQDGRRWVYLHDDVVWLRKNLEQAARTQQALEDATMNELLDLLIQDRLQKAWNPQ